MSKKASTIPMLISQPGLNLSCAWATAVLQIVDHPGTEIAPLILSVTDFDEEGTPDEDWTLRQTLDDMLVDEGHKDIETVAFTIFPQQLWKIAKYDRAELFAMYRDAFPRYQAMNRRDNRKGLYFERLVSYGSGPCDGNQLEWILSQYAKRNSVRRSMLQASIFDPSRDHVSSAQLQFPCMQHVSFEPTEEGLVTNAIYATQQLFIKAYGNYLGIARLGAFMAHEMNMKLARMNVFVGVAKLEGISKTDKKFQNLVPLMRDATAQGAPNPTLRKIQAVT